MKNIIVDKRKQKDDGLKVLKTSRPAQIGEMVWDDSELLDQYKKRDRRLLITRIVLVELVLTMLTMWLVYLAFQDRGYMAYGGEWLPMISINLFMLFYNYFGGDE